MCEQVSLASTSSKTAPADCDSHNVCTQYRLFNCCFHSLWAPKKQYCITLWKNWTVNFIFRNVSIYRVIQNKRAKIKQDIGDVPMILCSFSNLCVTSPTFQLILQHFRRFTYVAAHSTPLPLLHLRHSSFSKLSLDFPTSEALQLRHLASCPCWMGKRILII